jgi:hypothetical protein
MPYLSGVWMRFTEPAGSGILRLQNAVSSGLAVEFASPAASCVLPIKIRLDN